jgi:hypothetical protein
MLETHHARVARCKQARCKQARCKQDVNGLDLLATACEATTPTQKENCKPSPDMVKALHASAKWEFGLRPRTETTKTKCGQRKYRRRTVHQVGRQRSPFNSACRTGLKDKNRMGSENVKWLCTSTKRRLGGGRGNRREHSVECRLLHEGVRSIFTFFLIHVYKVH